MPSSGPEHRNDFSSTRLVLVQHDIVVQTFSRDDGGHAQRTAEMIALATGQPVDIYEVERSIRAGVAVGAFVDPHADGWSRIEQEKP